jgi:hypothetical protein
MAQVRISPPHIRDIGNDNGVFIRWARARKRELQRCRDIIWRTFRQQHSLGRNVRPGR